MSFPFPDLPIITPPTAERLSIQEKYGGLFYLGVFGLAAVVALIVWFGIGLASNWSVWTNIYRVHDQTRPLDERIVAADALARDPRVNQRQYWDMVQRPELPPLARYRLAEALTLEATETDPAGYARSVALSQGWPEWLRVLLIRPMAIAARDGAKFPAESLAVLRGSADPFVKVWAAYAEALQAGEDSVAFKSLEESAALPGPAQASAKLLKSALMSLDQQQWEDVEEAIKRLRTDSPEAAAVWAGWDDKRGRLERTTPVPKP